jgi:hypothetical protein
MRECIGAARRKVRGHYTKRNVWDDAADLEVIRGGERIDPGVNYFVLMLDQMGLQTHFSCEGHPDEFYVAFTASYEQALRVTSAGYFTVEIEGSNYWSMRWRQKGDGNPETSRVDALRWAAEAWQGILGPLDFEAVQLV